MPEKLAIVSIDAGSDVRGRVLDEPRIGTSSGKGTLAGYLRSKGFLANDSGRGYRTVAYAASDNGVTADRLIESGLLRKWERAGVFGCADVGLSFEGEVIAEEELHGKRISSIVADFGAIPEVRHLMKQKKMEWLNWAKNEHQMKLVALDGRGMREMVEDMAIRDGAVEGAYLATGFSMVVNPVEAARRRMSARHEVEYTDPAWYLAPGLTDTIIELRTRAIKDEDRAIDPVGIAESAFVINSKIIKEGFGTYGTTSAWERSTATKFAQGQEFLFDTTGLTTNTVESVAMHLISECTQGLVEA